MNADLEIIRLQKMAQNTRSKRYRAKILAKVDLLKRFFTKCPVLPTGVCERVKT